MTTKALVLIAWLTAVAFGQQSTEKENPTKDLIVEKHFVIIKSTTSYSEALSVARSASKKIGVNINLRGLKLYGKNKLTFGSEACDSLEGYPCYTARGRWDDGEYISIERSDAYSSMKRGYFIVVAASGDSETKGFKLISYKAKKAYSDAYSKRDSVYVGCMH